MSNLERPDMIVKSNLCASNYSLLNGVNGINRITGPHHWVRTTTVPKISVWKNPVDGSLQPMRVLVQQWECVYCLKTIEEDPGNKQVGEPIQ